MSKIVGWTDAADANQPITVETNALGTERFSNLNSDTGNEEQDVSVDENYHNPLAFNTQPTEESEIITEQDVKENNQEVTTEQQYGKYETEIIKTLEEFEQYCSEGNSDISPADYDHIIFMISSAQNLERLNYYKMEQIVYNLQRQEARETNCRPSRLNKLIEFLREKHLAQLKDELEHCWEQSRD